MTLNSKILVLLSIVLLGCSDDKRNFERQEELASYMRDVQSVEHDNPKSFVILIAGTCGSCNQETLSFLSKLGDDDRFSDYDKFIVIPKENFDLVDELKLRIGDDFEIFKDKDVQLLRYGLLFEKNVLIEYVDGNKIEHWDWMDMESLYPLNNHYFQ